MSGTIGRQIVRAVLIGGMAISALAIAQPALGYTELKVTGTVGAHSLWDTEAVPGATCLFKHRSGTYRLSHIGASPPRMKAVPGMGTEVVAWSFTVQRRIVELRWSRLHGRTATRAKSSRARLTPSTTRTSVANRASTSSFRSQAGGDASANYRVIVKLFWYESDGTTILGTATDRVDWYYPDQGKGVPTFHHFCPDYD